MSEPTEPPPHLGGEEPWRSRFVETIESAPRVVVLTDFDGTLSGITEDPDAASIRPDARDALERLVDDPRANVGVVSGRALADVRERVGLRGVAYAGNHGLEMTVGEGQVVHPEAEGATDAVERVSDRLRGTFADVEGVRVEDKELTATVHYRQVDEEVTVERVREAVRSAARPHDALLVSEGKQILELRPDVDWDKGRAVEWILETLPIDRDLSHPIYLGDDVTDEAAFEAVSGEGTGIVVGEDVGDSAAGYRLNDPAEVADLLRWLGGSATDDGGPSPDP